MNTKYLISAIALVSCAQAGGGDNFILPSSTDSEKASDETDEPGTDADVDTDSDTDTDTDSDTDSDAETLAHG